ncbi:hypothetical protein ACJX0J_039675, partial [Zea mays]
LWVENCSATRHVTTASKLWNRLCSPRLPPSLAPLLSLMRPNSPHPVPLATLVSAQATATQLPPRRVLARSQSSASTRSLLVAATAFGHRKETSNSRALFLLNLPSALTSWTPKLLVS